MKILQVIGVLNRGGAETLLMNIYEHIDRNKYQFDFLVFEDKEYPYTQKVKELGGNIIFIESPNKIGMFNYIKKLKILCQKNRYDVIHSHTLFNCGPTVFAAFLARVPIRISHCHSTQKLERKNSFKKQLYFMGAKVLLNVCSTHKLACGEASAKFLYYTKNYIVIKNGIDIEKFIFCADTRHEIRKRLHISDDVVLLGHVGRLMYIKNQMFLLKIMKNLEHNYKLILIGDGEMKNDLLLEIQNNGLNDKIIMTGNIDNVNDYYNAMDLFVFPSLFEGLPYTLIEAQTNGLNTIASQNISIESNISDNISFLPIGDNSLDLWIDKIINTSMNRYNAVNLVEEKGYSIINTVNQLKRIYEGN